MTPRAILQITPKALAKALGLPAAYDVIDIRMPFGADLVEVKIAGPHGQEQWPGGAFPLVNKEPLPDGEGGWVRYDTGGRVPKFYVTPEVPAEETRRLVPRLPSVLDEVGSAAE